MERVVAKKVTAMLVAVLVLLDFAYSASAANTCATVGVQMQPCVAALKGVTVLPTTACCNGLAQIQGFETQIGLLPTCNCTKGLLVQIPGLIIDFKLSTDVQNNCNVKLGFSLATTDGC